MRLTVIATGYVGLNTGVAAEAQFASNPEFLRERFALHDTFYPDRIVVGADHEAAVKALKALYEPILHQTFAPPAAVPRPVEQHASPLVATDPTSAEMFKYAPSAFLATKIGIANEIAGSPKGSERTLRK